ncbi:MAG TPA: DUF5668 domain-containing protein [Acidobacteriota bacterium]|nr:DUF5668 domain-containing protein [Acidobacteriota bacterium]
MSHKLDDRQSGMLIGLILIAIGIIFLGERYDWFGLNLDLGMDKIWPVFLIIGGFYFILKHR